MAEFIVKEGARDYPREAISSFAAAVERFYEFAIMVLIRSSGIAPDVSSRAWKLVASQSERQFGAFVFLWLSAYKELPITVSQKMVQLRNDVVHKGRLPDRASALAYGEDAYGVITEGVRKLRASHLDAVNAVLGEEVAARAQKMGAEFPRSFMVTPTVLNVILNVSSGVPPFAEIVRTYRKVP